MAEVAASSSRTDSLHAPHGTKRAADGSLEREQRLSKRFDLMNLGTRVSGCSNAHVKAKRTPVDDHGTRLYIGRPGAAGPHASPLASPTTDSGPGQLPQHTRPPRPPPSDDAMLVEDTPHRVYIHDLAAELRDIESDEDTPIFLSDIEKHLSKIPRHLLRGPEPKSTEDNQLVLYNVPASLTVPSEQDSVRKAIVEARQRIREKQVSSVSEPTRVFVDFDPTTLDMPMSIGSSHYDDQDEDAMDID